MPNDINKINYKRYRNFYVRLFKKEKKKFYNNLDTKLITDNKGFWKTIKPMFSQKKSIACMITLLEDNNLIYKNEDVAETFNDFFSNAVCNLNIQGYTYESFSYNNELDEITNMIIKFKNHPSILMRYFEERTKKYFRGRNRTTIVSALNRDIKKKKDFNFPLITLTSQVSLQNFRKKATKRKLWAKIVK